MGRGDLAEVASGVFSVSGTDVRWLVVTEGDDVTLVDCGWSGDGALVLDALRRIGFAPQAVRAILVTHAHIDHIGACNTFHARYGTPTLAHPIEVEHCRRTVLEQAGPAVILARAWRPRVAAWALRVARVGGLGEITVPHAQPYSLDGPLDLPGRPVPVPTPGHTSGHSAYWFPAAGVLASGDALVTGHPVSPERGPQVLPGYFSHDRAEAIRSLDALAQVDAGVLVPGHGPVTEGPVRDLVHLARDRAARGSRH